MVVAIEILKEIKKKGLENSSKGCNSFYTFKKILLKRLDVYTTWDYPDILELTILSGEGGSWILTYMGCYEEYKPL